MKTVEYQPCMLFNPGDVVGEYLVRMFDTSDYEIKAGEVQDFLNDGLVAGYGLVTLFPVGPPARGQVLCVLRRVHEEVK